MSQKISSAEQPTLNTTLNVNSKIHTSFKPNANFVPPEDFALLPSLQEVLISPKRATEIPVKTQHDYTNDDYKYKDFLPYVTLTSEPALTPYEHIDVATGADPEKKAFSRQFPTART